MASTAALPIIPARGNRGGRVAFILFLALTALPYLIGCAGKDFSTLQPGINERGHYIADVPFYRQEEDACGPAALASVALFWGEPVDVKEIRARVYLPELRGTLPMDMERYLRESGFQASSSSGTLDELKARIRGNVPVICLLDLGFSLYRRPHYVIAIGFDDVNSVFIVHDGIEENAVVRYKQFVKAWGRAGNWMLVALPGTPSPQEKQ